MNAFGITPASTTLLAVLGAMPSGSSEPAAPASGGGLGEAFGEAIGSGLGVALGLVFAALLLLFIGMWVGSAIGTWRALRARRLAGASGTAVVAAVLFPFWTVVAIVVLATIGGAISNDILGLVLLLAFVPAAAIPPALAGRALHRFRTTGGP